MSRWFRHYAGMMRDDKLVSAALKARQPIERVLWVWGAILESAAEIESKGQFDVDPAEVAYFLHAEDADISSVFDALEEFGLVDGSSVVGWSEYDRRSARLPWSEWAVIRLSVFQRDNFTCHYCGASGIPLDCDHVVPLSRGGSNDKTNLVAACKPCNQSKGDKMPNEWRAA